jgi:hypothetical protein
MTPALAAPPARDGSHDFDFAIGQWHIHLRKLMHPLAGSHEWVEFDGTATARKVWNGRAQLDEVEMTSPSGPIEGLTLRTYNPKTQAWSLYWANSKDGIVAVPPQVGRFENGVGVFDAPDTFNGKQILVRFTWSKTSTDTPHFEQSFSADGGKTWEVNWITDQTRVKGATN